MGKCSILAHIVDLNGNVVESKLYKDLLHYTSNNRSLTKQNYAVGTNKEFLDKVRPIAEFDKNGEITLKSLKNLLDLDIDNNTLIQVLNKDLGAGIMSYDEAIARVSSFNKNSQYNDKFMATLISTKDGKYEIKVVEKNDENSINLEEAIKKATLQNKIIQLLNKAGVAVDFIEKDEKINGKYSTENAEKTADGLYHLIQIVNGEESNEVLAEEAGHFIIGAMNKSPLVSRLLSLLTDEVQERLLGDEYTNKYLGNSSRREVAGTLVGKALINQPIKKGPWKTLIDRIITIAKRVFASIKKDDVLKASLEAKKIAEELAKGFTSSEFSGDIENALKTKETLYNAQTTYNTEVFNNILKILKVQAKQMNQISSTLFDKYNALSGKVELGRYNAAAGALADAISLEGIAEAVSIIRDLLENDIPKLLESVNFTDTKDFYKNLSRNGKALRQVRVFTSNALAILKILESATNKQGTKYLRGDLENIKLLDNLGYSKNVNLKLLREQLSRILIGENGILENLKNKEYSFFLRFLEDSYGSKYIERSARVLFNFKAKGRFLIFKKAENVPIEDYLKHLDEDISLYDRWMSSMSNNPDIVGQICDKVYKEGNKRAGDFTRKDYLIINNFKKEFDSLKKRHLVKSTRDLYETDEYGKLTGNFLSEYNYGLWENDYNNFYQQSKEEFIKNNPDIITKPDFEFGLAFDYYFKPLSKQWHREHSTPMIDNNTNSFKYVPNLSYNNGKYNNYQYEQLSPEVKDYIRRLSEFKTSIDERLGEAHGVNYRIPQFKSGFIGKVHNTYLSGEDVISTLFSSMRKNITDTFCDTMDESELGSDSTYNDESEDFRFKNVINYELEKIHRIPLYGINKLKNMNDLSTDIFGSLLAYSTMANNYMASSLVADVFEVGKTTLLERSVKGFTSEINNIDGLSRAYTRYTKYLDKVIYNIKQPKLILRRSIVINKIGAFFTGLAAKVYLGGNVHGGAVNFGTGFLEVFKEAFAGEDFGLKDWTIANKEYFKYVPAELLESAKQFKTNKLGLFINKFDILNENSQDWKNWKSDKSGLNTLLEKSLWFPYKSGEHYMQSIPYIGVALNTKLYTPDGKKTTLWDIYTAKDEELVIDSNYPYYFKNKEDINTFKIIESILDKIKDINDNPSPILKKNLVLTDEESEYIESENLSIDNLSNLEFVLNDKKNDLVWNESDEASYQMKTREITNRMHGIYNNIDKNAFQQTIYGNLLLAMRGYALGMIERRFGSSKYSVILKRETSGSLSDVAKMFIFGLTERGQLGLALRALLMPFGKKTKERVLNAGFSEHQFRNMRRNLADLLVMAALAIIKALSAPEDDDDDEEDDYYEDESNNQGLGLAYYFSSRLLREQMAFNSVRGMRDESKNLLDLMPIGVSIALDLATLTYQFAGQQFVEPSDERLSKDELPPHYTDFYYNQRREGKYEYGDSKAEKKALRLIPYVKSYYILQDPYEAWKSFEYAQNIKK